MEKHYEKNISDFRVVGINYKKTDAAMRGLFAINHDQYVDALKMAPQFGLNDLFIVSTCNRTEIYGFAHSYKQMTGLLCAQSQVDPEVLQDIIYSKSGWEAIAHLFNVSAGLDSQILGDYEILGQIKNAAKTAKGAGCLDSFLERVVNSALQSSKAVRTHTGLSGGTVSVSFAAVQYIREHIADAGSKKILLVGTGKIGCSTCKNLIHYLGNRNITLVNRTEEKAAQLAEELHIYSAPLELLNEEIRKADIIMVATNANEPTILRSNLEGCSEKLIIDLSIPFNVAHDVQTLPGVTVVDVDTLSKIKDETLQNRAAEVPKALQIIDEHIGEFKEWYNMRRYVPMLKDVKSKLKQMHTDVPEEQIQKFINTLAAKVRTENTAGCHYIQAISEFTAC